jgi:SAM-dependent methyltransferase
MKNKNSIFSDYGRYYNLLYKDKDYIGEADYIHSLLSRYGVTRGQLLELGSGTGKHGRLLAGLGYNVYGVERSPEMIEQSFAVPGFECHQGDICTINLNRSFDAVLSLFHVISYQILNIELLAVFNGASAHLDINGLFIFDFWYSPAVYKQQPMTRVKFINDAELEIIRIAEPSSFPQENRVDVNYTIIARDLSSNQSEVSSETHSMRHFSMPEIDMLAASSGFERIHAEEFFSAKPVGLDTWGVCVVLRKKSHSL